MGFCNWMLHHKMFANSGRFVSVERLKIHSEWSMWWILSCLPCVALHNPTTVLVLNTQYGHLALCMQICMQYQPEPLRLRFKTITCSKLWCFTVHTKFSALIKTYMHSQYVAINIFGLYWVRMFEKFTLIYCVLGVCCDTCVEARGQLTGFHFLLLPCRSRRSNSGHQDCWHLAENWNYKISWRTRHDGILQKS